MEPPEAVVTLVRAAEVGDAEALQAVWGRLESWLAGAGPAEAAAAVTLLADTVRTVPAGRGGGLAHVLGRLLPRCEDPADGIRVLAGRTQALLEDAAGFVGAWGEEDLPDPEDWGTVPATQDELARRAGRPREAVRDLVEGWFVSGQWAHGLATALLDGRVRRALPDRDPLTGAAARVEDHPWSRYLMLLSGVLDDEPLLVLHRPSGRGYRLTISGVADNFQLHTLLAATLIGDPADGLVEGERPEPAWVAAATDGDPLPGRIEGRLQLLTASGAWIWNEGVPAGIPELDGVRTVVLEPPPYPRSWDTGRPIADLVPSVTLDEVLPDAEARRWLDRVRPSAP